MTAQNATVVVGISTRDRSDLLRKAIRSALDQQYRPLRVAVIDDGSTDDTPAIRAEFSEVSWERWGAAQGYVRARNYMMLTAEEDYYVSLDDDAWFLRGDEIAVAVDLMQRDASIAAVAFDILSPDRPRPAERGKSSLTAAFIGCGHVLRLSTVKALHGYSEFPGEYGGEEKDFCLTLIDAGYHIVKLDGVHVWHEKTMTARDVNRQYSSLVCNDLAFMWRRAPLALVLPLVGHKLLSNFLFAVRNGYTRPFTKGLVNFAASAGKMWSSRNPVKLGSLMTFMSISKWPREFAR